jgi:hypothetical protein
MTNVVLNCHNCGTQVQLTPGVKIYRQDTCHQCNSDLHCCLNCRFFDPGKNNQCSETQAEWVPDKNRSNFCEYFEPRTTVNLVNKTRSRPDEARKQFDSLFKKR